MAAFVYTDAALTINGVDLSTKVKSVTLTIDVAAIDATAMGGAGYVTNVGGLKSGSLAVTFNDDLAASSTDVTIFPLLGTVVAFTLKSLSSANAATNPQYSGSVLISGTSIGGGVGELAAKSVTWPTSGAISRATA